MTAVDVPSSGADRDQPGSGPGGGVSRRRFIGYLIAGPILIAGVRLVDPTSASAAIPTVQLPVDEFDLSDLLSLSCDPTNELLTVAVTPAGIATFALPRAEVGQGLTTSVAMIIADEIGLPLSKVQVTLRDADPALVYNQLTGGSNSIHSLYQPVRTASAAAREQLMRTAAAEHGGAASDYEIRDGVVHGPAGRTIDLGTLSTPAAVARSRVVHPKLKARAALGIVGTSQGRVDAHDIVTGRKVFAMDISHPGALPTMVCRPPTINGDARSVSNMAQVKAMPGITDVAIIPHTQYVAGGVAVRGETFGQCIDAIDALDVDWGPGTADGASDASVANELLAAEAAFSPALPGTVIDQRFTFHFRPGDPLETNCAVADVQANSAEIWSSLKSPIFAQEQIALNLGMSANSVVVHVTQGGGSFGRHLFCDAAFEAAAISQKLQKPVKLMWARTDNFRQGRVHPMCTSRVRAVVSGGNVVSFDQHHTSVATDFTQGLGDAITANAAEIPGGNYAEYSFTVFTLTSSVPYNFGAVTQLLNEIDSYNTFNTSSVRNIYSPDVCTATELMVDQIAAAMKIDPLAFRLQFARDARMLAVLQKLQQIGGWGRAMPAGTAQGLGIHSEYKGRIAVLAEIDCRPTTVRRKIKNAFTGPRVTKMVMVADVGLAINPLGLEAQLMGGAMDGIAQALTYSLHLQDGHYLEGSWDNAYYTRQWNSPPEMEFVVMPPTTGDPGGAGELGVAPSMAAVACAYSRATGTLATEFPVNHNAPLGFTPYPTTPSLPESLTDGLKYKGKPTAV